MQYFVFSILVLVSFGCASKSPDFGDRAFHTRIYLGTYDRVWLAALKALSDYPLKISNKDVGKIETEVINGPYNDLLFKYPDPLGVPERFRYSVKMRFAKLEDEDSEPAVRIRIGKHLEKYRDFYTGWVPGETDGLEEQVLLYRVEHLLRMDAMLSKQGY